MSVQHRKILERLVQRSPLREDYRDMLADREMLEKVAEHLVFLKRLASSPGPIRNNGKIVGKWQTVAAECQAAHDKLMEHLNA